MRTATVTEELVASLGRAGESRSGLRRISVRRREVDDSGGSAGTQPFQKIMMAKVDETGPGPPLSHDGGGGAGQESEKQREQRGA